MIRTKFPFIRVIDPELDAETGKQAGERIASEVLSKWGGVLRQLAMGPRTMPRKHRPCTGRGCAECLDTGVVYDEDGAALRRLLDA